MIATLTLNPSLDLSVSLKSPDYRDINRIPEIQKDPGGKGINISRIIKRLKGETVAYGLVGGYTGTKISALLKEEGVRTAFVRIEGENRSNISIDMPGRENHIKINENGPSVSNRDIASVITRLKFLGKNDFLVMSGSLPAGAGADTYAKIASATGKKGAKIVIDSDGESLFLGLRSKPFMIKPNIYEAQRLLRRMGIAIPVVRNEADLLKTAVKLGKCGAEISVISWGSHGIIVNRNGEIWRSVPPFKLKEAGVGAGDAVVAGFVFALSMGKNIESGIRWGVACGTASALNKGTSLCAAADIRKILKRIKVKAISRLS